MTLNTIVPAATCGDEPDHESMTSADILVCSSLLAMSLSVGSLIAVSRVHRKLSAERSRSAQHRASQAAMTDQLHAAVGHIGLLVEQTCAPSRAPVLAEMGRRIEVIASDGLQQTACEFAATEPMGLVADLRLVASPSHAVQGPRRVAAPHRERA